MKGPVSKRKEEHLKRQASAESCKPVSETNFLTITTCISPSYIISIISLQVMSNKLPVMTIFYQVCEEYIYLVVYLYLFISLFSVHLYPLCFLFVLGGEGLGSSSNL